VFFLGEISGVLKKFKELTVPELMNQKRTDRWFKDIKPAIIFGANFWGKISVANLMIFKE
jgi:hypothetical protein